MRVTHRADLPKDTEAPYCKLRLQDIFWGETTRNIDDGSIPIDAYPLQVVHSDDDGYLILLLDENDENSTILVQSIDFDFIEEGE